jgi:large subunit ribosomal protein L25
VTSSRPTLAAATRTETGKANAHLRKAGRVPAVLFGNGESVSISVDAHEFAQMRRHAGANELVDLAIDEKHPTPVLVHGVQLDKLSRRPIHVDLFRVRMTDELTVDVGVHSVGSSEAVEKHGGTLMHSIDHIRVKARPDHLPSHLEADVSGLVDFDGVIRAGEIKLPAGVTLVTDPEEIVFRVLAPRVSEELAAGETAPTESEATPAAEAATE